MQHHHGAGLSQSGEITGRGRHIRNRDLRFIAVRGGAGVVHGLDPVRINVPA